VRDAPPPRGPGPLRRALPWFIASVLVATIGLPSAGAVGALPSAPLVGTAHPESGNSTVRMNLTDAPRFDPRSLVANASATVSIHLENVGAYTHTFTLSKVANVVLNTSWSPTQLDAFFAANGSLANVSVAPGGQAWANVSLNASTGADSFEFVSVVPYQFQSGMWGFLNVSATGPGLMLFENTTDQYQFVPAILNASLPAHYPEIVDVLVTNQGSLGHTFTVSPLSNYTLGVGNFSQTFATNAPFVSAPVPSGAGSSVWANFTVRGPGVYQYICTVAGHYANGMTGELYVGVPVPPPVPTPSTAIVQGWVLLGSGVLLGIGVVVAAVASYVGRFPRAPGEGGHH
jgi:uncharacterized cupredoxin-like copper-binding protein